MDHHHWQRLSERIEEAADGEVGGLETLESYVEAGELDLSRTPEILDETGLDAQGASRLIRLWTELADHGRTATDGEAMAVATRLTRYGDYPTRRLIREPSTANWLAGTRWRNDPMPRPEMRAELKAYIDAERTGDGSVDGQLFGALLRRFRHRQLLRVFLREIEGASVRRTTAEVADVAQVCMEAAVERAAAESDLEEAADRICVMGMGKLGGRELNFSSDIDVVFTAADEVADRLGAFEDLARRAVELMDGLTDEGRVFRVDLRLRPEGSRGRLVVSESALVEYYLNWGRTWERGAWLKARPVAGDPAIGERILERLEPFLYRRYLDFEVIDELRRMKELIDEESKASEFVHGRSDEQPGDEAEVSGSPSTSPFKARLLDKFDDGAARRSGDGSSERAESSGTADGREVDKPEGWDVKIGEGGIREIEFFVQALQLVHSGTRPDIRVRTTLAALDRLLYNGLVSAADHRKLTDGYDLFRRLEHLVQVESDRQAHRLPAGPRRFADLAGRMKMEPDELRSAVETARSEVRTIFERLFSESPRTPERATVGEEREGILEQIIGLNSDRLLDEEVVDRLRDAGFERPRQVAGQLQVLRRKPHGPFSESPTSADPALARYLLGAIRDAPRPEEALGRLVRFSTSVGDTPAMWAMLSDNPHAARLLIHLFGSSQPIGDLLAEEPDLFERLIYSASARLVRSREKLDEELGRRLGDIDNRARRMGRIRRFHREQVVRIALHEVAGAIEVDDTCRQLTDLAELVLEALVREVVDEYARSDEEFQLEGDPVETLALSVVGMGKLGGREMGFGSDLDFVFVYDGDDENGIDQQTATRIAQRLVRAMSTATEIGDLYEVDLRLRPSGSRGTLVVSLEAWREYYCDRAEFWERLALVRARPLTGPDALREAIEEGRDELAFGAGIPEDADREIADMRRRLAEEAEGTGEAFDVKFDPGGLLDIEFLTQWLQLIGDAGVVGRECRSTVDALGAVAESGRAAGGVEPESLIRDYRWLRRLECRLALGGTGRVVPEEGPIRRALARQMGHQGRGDRRQFDAELQAVRKRVREAWTAVFG